MTHKIIFKKKIIETKEYTIDDAFHKIIENQQAIISLMGFFRKFLDEKLDVSEYEFTGQEKYENPFYHLEIMKDCAEENKENIKSIRDYFKKFLAPHE